MTRIVFMGTPDFAVPSLRGLIDAHDVIGVVTQPDRPAGRRGKLKAPPVKLVAQENGIPVFQPEKLRRAEAIEHLKQWQADVYIVAAFGQILPQSVLDIPPHGCLNVHASLLPRWRGAAPIQAAIRAGDDETGVTIMQMDAGLDTGPMLSKQAITIAPDETGQSLHDKLADIGAQLLLATLPGYVNGSISPQPQDDEHATYAPQIKKSDGEINWQDDAAAVDRQVRAYTPWPGTYTFWGDNQLKIHAGRIADGSAEPGKVITHDSGIAIGTGSGLYVPETLQMAGKKPVSAQDFINGYPEIVDHTLHGAG